MAQALSALCGLESVSARAAGVSQGLLGWAAYTGAAASGLPLSWLIQGPWGWNAWRAALTLGCTAITALLLPLWRLPSYEQRRRKDEDREDVHRLKKVRPMSSRPISGNAFVLSTNHSPGSVCVHFI